LRTIFETVVQNMSQLYL